jgi:hypothetical protein
MIVLILVGTAAIASLLIVFLFIVIAGIRVCERHTNLAFQPITQSERIARYVLVGIPIEASNKEVTK